MKKIPLAFLLLASCATGPAPRPPSDLVVCGADEVFVLDLRASEGPRKVWSWRAADHPELPEPLRQKFGSTDECKPVDGGRKVLISSSGGAVALVERPSGRILFSAAAVNAHSAEILPGNRVAICSSTGEGGNLLLLYDLADSGRPLASDEIKGTHGAVWDPDRRLLWVLGELELRAYEVGETSLVRKVSRMLPNPGGHDLRPVPGSPALMVTTGQHVWVFDRDLLTFRTHPRIGDLEHVKCVDFDVESGALVYVQAGKSWWAEHIRFLGMDRVLDFPGQKIYKARWMPRSE